jgi:hypothetical protein
VTAMRRFEEEPQFHLEPTALPVQKEKRPAPVPRADIHPGELSIDHLRTVLPQKKPKRARYNPSRFLGDEYRPSVRSRKPTTKANRKLRAGRRAQLLSTPLNRDERRDVEQDELDLAAAGVGFELPINYGACPPGRCANVRCRHHLAVDVEVKKGKARLKVLFPDVPVWQMRETCSLRVADKADLRRTRPGSFQPVMSLDEVGELLNLTAERTRTEEARALRKFRERAEILGLRDDGSHDG